MKIGGLRASSFGIPAYMNERDDAEFVLGSGLELARGHVFREVALQDQWQIANMTYKKGGSIVVSDFRGKESYRTWQTIPTDDKPGRGVVLKPLHEGGTFFRGTKAFVVEPMMLASGLKAILAHIGSQETFNRVSVAAATGKGWGDVSRWMSLMHNFAFIDSTEEPTTYGADDPIIISLKSEKDRLHAPGNKMNYKKTARWDESLMPQWEEFQKSGAKTVEVAP